MSTNRFRQGFLSLSIRTKIILGILATGGLALVIFAIVTASQTNQITSTLSNRLETSVSQLAEEQLRNTANEQAVRADESFRNVKAEVESLAQTWTSLQKQRRSLREGVYWDAMSNMVQLKDGRYGNSTNDPSSVYIPAGLTLDDANLIADLNTSAYLDFYAPGVLASHPSILAIFAVDERGVTRYYPNNDLASILPPGFNANQRPYYEITAPLFNPERKTRWSIPYMDAAGGGLVMTIAAPFYVGEEFNGVVAADMQLTELTQQVKDIKIGETGFAFLLDDAGRMIAMPPEGYQLFGIDENSINTEEIDKQTILERWSRKASVGCTPHGGRGKRPGHRRQSWHTHVRFLCAGPFGGLQPGRGRAGCRAAGSDHGRPKRNTETDPGRGQPPGLPPGRAAVCGDHRQSDHRKCYRSTHRPPDPCIEPDR